MNPGLERLLVELSAAASESAAEILERCARIDVDPAVPYFHGSFRDAVLLAVDEGFLVLRSAPEGRLRSVVTCEAGPGRLILPPSADEVLFGLTSCRLLVIDGDCLARLLAMPELARVLLEQLALTLGQKQEAIGNFADTRHADRVRRKLLQLGRNYGRVSSEGVRIDFPVSHSLLAEMIGSSRETVTRALEELQRAGFVERRGHSYRLLVAPESVPGTA